eukprot:TRINITY_DN27989_c0_g1_i1.p1 TRINITY_DN27989_c0_g1~~TRINITY_DN27989_c0_g1_i1.p1  ORF type:complete len:442 (-),score=72.06 TRINITY_DN27989_c0_g1_i1:280-1461(-)
MLGRSDVDMTYCVAAAVADDKDGNRFSDLNVTGATQHSCGSGSPVAVAAHTATGIDTKAGWAIDRTVRLPESPQTDAARAAPTAKNAVDRSLELQVSALQTEVLFLTKSHEVLREELASERAARVLLEAQVIMSSGVSTTAASQGRRSPSSSPHRPEVLGREVERRRGTIDSECLAAAPTAALAVVPETRGRSSASRPLNDSVSDFGGTNVASLGSFSGIDAYGGAQIKCLAGRGSDAATASARSAARAAVAAAAAAFNAENTESVDTGIVSEFLNETKILGDGLAEEAQPIVDNARASAVESNAPGGDQENDDPVEMLRQRSQSHPFMPSPRMLQIRSRLASSTSPLSRSPTGPSPSAPQQWRPSAIDRWKRTRNLHCRRLEASPSAGPQDW